MSRRNSAAEDYEYLYPYESDEYEEYEDDEEDFSDYNNLITSIKQKLMGIGLLVMTFLILKYGWTYDPMTGCNDATFALVTVPLGLYSIFTKKRIIY